MPDKPSAQDLYEALLDALDTEGHDEDCVLRCANPTGCRADHHCAVCADDDDEDIDPADFEDVPSEGCGS